MIRHWTLHVRPLIEAAAPKQLMEIGADTGVNTLKLLGYCRRVGAKLDVIDPAPRPSLGTVMARYPVESQFYRKPSLTAIPMAQSPDLVILDGDHNWSTVSRELALFAQCAAARDRLFPIVLAHDVAWPYARRDMYYFPDQVDEKHAHAKVGLMPGNPGTVEDGMNSHLENALVEGGPRNGVLTAFEDFLATTAQTFSFTVLPFFNGLGILVPAPRMTAPLREVIDSFASADHLMKVAVALEAECMRTQARLAATYRRLMTQTEVQTPNMLEREAAKPGA